VTSSGVANDLEQATNMAIEWLKEELTGIEAEAIITA
jgi:hypothetical protein